VVVYLISANPHANGGILLKDLRLPDFRDYAIEVWASTTPDAAGRLVRSGRSPPRDARRARGRRQSVQALCKAADNVMEQACRKELQKRHLTASRCIGRWCMIRPLLLWPVGITWAWKRIDPLPGTWRRIPSGA